MPLQGKIAEAFITQGRACRSFGSPFTGHLCERLVALLDDSTAVGRVVGAWPEDPVVSALALRLCGALNAIVRAGNAPTLASHYPPVADTGPVLDAALCAAIARHGDDLVALLDSAPQTNEVARSAILVGGLLILAAETGLPLSLLEIGSSAGLNLHTDCYAYDLGVGRRWGPEDAPLTIASDWRGDIPPLDAPLRVIARAGSDIAPIDPSDGARMLAYIWPDQPARMQRNEAALAHAAAHRTSVERADAADWVEARLAAPPDQNVVRVLLHSIMWQYLPAKTQDRIGNAMERAGSAGSATAPLAWLRLEPDGIAGSAAILLTLWPGGATRLLGRGDYHGRFAERGGVGSPANPTRR